MTDFTDIPIEIILLFKGCLFLCAQTCLVQKAKLVVWSVDWHWTILSAAGSQFFTYRLINLMREKHLEVAGIKPGSLAPHVATLTTRSWTIWQSIKVVRKWRECLRKKGIIIEQVAKIKTPQLRCLFTPHNLIQQKHGKQQAEVEEMEEEPSMVKRTAK